MSDNKPRYGEEQRYVKGDQKNSEHGLVAFSRDVHLDHHCQEPAQKDQHATLRVVKKGSNPNGAF